MTRMSVRPATRPACSIAHGMDNNEVPIMVFHTANLAFGFYKILPIKQCTIYLHGDKTALFPS